MNVIFQMATTYGIIGTAGRKHFIDWLNQEVFDYMYSSAAEFIGKKVSGEWSRVHLVSGGAAWADHVAVRLFLSHPDAKLSLFIPAAWKNGKFESKTANWYHELFEKKTGIHSLAEIEECRVKGAVLKNYDGFRARDLKIGTKSEWLLAFTFDEKEPMTGGTGYTWKNAKTRRENKIFFSLQKFSDRCLK
ncbi:MAG: hypothetical protein ACYCOU_18045 [Sulfobacillus sp.]